VSRLSKTYPGGVEAVKEIDFEVATGEVFGLLGPNGAGKSTTIGMLTTTILPTSGTARLAGLDVVKEPLAARRLSSVVFQEAVVDRGLTGRQNIELHARLWSVEPSRAKQRTADTAAALGVEEILDRPVDSYSGGQRRRLEIARALVSTPRVLFLDEPTVGLDPRIRHELLDVIATLRERDEMTIILTTHYLDEAQQLCDRVGIMHEGRIVALDSPRELLHDLGRELVELRIDGDIRSAFETLRFHRIADENAFAIGATVTLPLHDRTAAQAIAAVGELDLPVAGISSREPTLDDVYLRLTGDRITGDGGHLAAAA
jgi:ABC-2 type transport system ATP-binding protein